MRYRSLHKWDNVEESVGLIFVAQLLDELLFEYTLDTYKPSAMNTSLLIGEAITTIRALESGTIKRPNLPHILNELCANLKRDDVAKSLLSVDLDGVLATLQNPKSSTSSWTTTVELLSNQLRIMQYKKRTEELLIKELNGEQSFSVLRSLTRSYVTTLLNIGYSQKFIKNESKDFFFYSSSRIANNQAITDYIGKFSGDKKTYNVIYRAPKYLKSFSDSGNQIGIKVGDELQEFDTELQRFKFNLSSNEIYLLVEGVESKDPYFAKGLSDHKVELLQTLVGLFHHKESPEPIIECLVYDIELKSAIKVTHSINPMHRCNDFKPGVASKKLAEFMAGFSMRGESFRKFNRSSELHALALNSESKENQMINLWIALESLVPNKPDDEKSSQIEHLSSSILPFLNLSYIKKIITRFSKDLWGWDSRLAKRLMKDVDAEGYVKKLTYMLSLDEYKDLRSSLESSMKDFHLLKDRYHYIQYLLSAPKNIVTALNNHTQRIEWQIRRIYRARNLIVHDGNTPSYTDVLIENTHDYLDTVMNSLMVMASAKNTLNSIDQGFKMMELNYLSYYKSLSKKELVFTKDNIDRLLFSSQI